jgi:hypothetical protein
MLHVYVQKFDVTGNIEKFCKILKTKRALRKKTFEIPKHILYFPQ